MAKRKGKALIASAVAAFLLALTCVSACAPSSTVDAADNVTARAASSERLTIEEWGELHPDQYASFATTGWNVDKGVGAGHYYMFQNMQMWDHANLNCLSCKTTQWNDLTQVYDGTTPLAELVPEINAFFDCYICHTDPETLEVAPGVRSFDTKRETYIPDAPVGTILCGQCHTGYTAGFDIDAIYAERGAESAEKGADEATGALNVSAGHPDVEIFYESTHANLGLTCIDCHMPTIENANGQPMTNHNASGRLTDNLEALNTCLDCHAAQGVEDAAQMRDFVRNAQAELYAEGEDARALINKLGDMLKEATAAGEESEALDQAREDYSRSKFNLTYIESKHKLGNKVAHDPEEQHEIVAQAVEIAQHGIDLLS